jgi:hypothetical protein
MAEHDARSPASRTPGANWRLTGCWHVFAVLLGVGTRALPARTRRSGRFCKRIIADFQGHGFFPHGRNQLVAVRAARSDQKYSGR